ncbi:cytochrome P450 [Trichoderma pleuroticola]
MKARWSRFWLIWIDISGSRSKTIHELHQKYGSVVRIGPREVSFSSRQAMKDLYGSGNKFMKGPTEHRSRQKRITHVFAPASIATVEPLVKEQIQKLLHVLSKRTNLPLDVMEWFRIFALDVVGSVFFGQSFGGLDNEAPPEILYDLDEVFPSLLIEWQFSAIRPLLLAIPHKPMQHFLRIASEFYDVIEMRKYGTEKFNDYIARHGRSGDRIDLLTKLIAGSKDYGPLDDNEIINEMTNLIFAGTDTTSNTLTYMFYELAKHSQWQKQLQTELDEAALGEVPEYKDVMKLRVLDAIIHETLRLHPAAPASLQRLAPSEGGAVVDGIVIPQNGIASCQAYTTQRDPTVYPNPERFDPGRWLDASEDHLNAMHEHILPMAYMELKVGTAALMGKFVVEIGSATIDDDMEMTDHFALVPKGKRCILRLKERS